MANEADWQVLDHEPIEKLTENVWRVRGAIPHMSLKRVMTVARRRSGELVIHSAIALREAAQRELEQWGTPKVLLVPNGGHRLDAPRYKRRYPALSVLAPAGSLSAVAKKLHVDGSYESFAGADDVWLEPLAGVDDKEGAMLVRSADGVTLVLNDVMFNMDRKRDPLGFLITSLFGSAPGPRVSRLSKLMFVRDKAALRASLLRYADMPELRRVIVAHENVASGQDAAASLRRAATYLR